MAGMLDFLFPQGGGTIGGGMLDYLTQPLYRAQQAKRPEDISALLQSPYEGALPQLQSGTPQLSSSIWDQPGIKYATPPAPTVWDNPSSVPSSWLPPPQATPTPPPLPAPTAVQPVPQPPAQATPPQEAQLPPNAQPTQGQLPPQVARAPEAAPNFGLGNNLMAGFQNFANAGGPLQALGGLVQGLSTGGRTDPLGMQQQSIQASYTALRDAGVPANQALAAAMNPKILEKIAPEYFGKNELVEAGIDPLTGQKRFLWKNAVDQTLTPAEPQGGGTGSAPSNSLFAPGVKEYNPNLPGPEYLAQFGPDMQAAMKAHINGDVMPTGNPRAQQIWSMAKTYANTYAEKMGIPFSDAIYSEKRKYRTELGSNSPNTAGGQAKAFNQGISHLTDLADKLEKLDNSNGLGVPLIAQGVNAVRQGASNQQSAISDEAKSLGQTVAGEVGKLFSGSAGGGVHERELTRERFDTVKSKPQLAAALRATIETMEGGLAALEQRRDSILGPNSNVEFVSAETRKNIDKIQGVIDRLEGKSSAGLPSGWSVKVH